MKTLATKNKQNNRIMLLALLVPVLFLLGFGVYAYATHNWPFSPTTTDTSSDSSDINYGPPTEQDIKDGQGGKQDLIDEQDNDSDQGSGAADGVKKSVEVGITFSEVKDGQVEIRAFIPGVVEGDGTCTATLTKGSSVVTESTKAFVDSTTTQCRPIYIPVSKFSSGTWKLFVSYSSSKSAGKSEIVDVTI